MTRMNAAASASRPAGDKLYKGPFANSSRMNQSPGTFAQEVQKVGVAVRRISKPVAMKTAGVILPNSPRFRVNQARSTIVVAKRTWVPRIAHMTKLGGFGEVVL